MPAQTTPHTEPEQRFRPDELFRAIERNRGRLQTVVYACFGLSNSTGNEAACLVWILDDVLSDIDRIELSLRDVIVIDGASTEIPLPVS